MKTKSDKMNSKRIYVEKFDLLRVNFRAPVISHDPIDHPKVNELRRRYQLDRFCRPGVSELQQVLALAKWVCSRWKHTGVAKPLKKHDALSVLAAAEKGGSFSCIQFASVFVQCCHALGIPARSIQITTKRPDLGDSGQAHWTTEYWDNQFQKWVWVDANVHAYAIHKNRPLNFAEYLKSKCKPTFSKQSLEAYGSLKSMREADKKFFRRYSGTITYGLTRPTTEFYTRQAPLRYCLLLSGAKPFVVFQGFAMNQQHYVTEEDFYSSVNRTQIAIETLPPKATRQFKDLNDYKENRFSQFALPKIKLHLKHNMLWFKEFEIKLNGKIIRRSKDTELELSLQNGRNSISVSATNKAGRKGPVSEIVVRYDDHYPKVKSFW